MEATMTRLILAAAAATGMRQINPKFINRLR